MSVRSNTCALQTSAGRPGSRLLGLGVHRPAGVMTNADVLARAAVDRGRRIDESWIERRTGIRERGVATPAESVVAMAASASAKAIADAGIDAAEVGMVLLATCSITRLIPNGAATVASMVGAHYAAALDVNAACSGFCYALGMADALIRSGATGHVLIVGSERMRDWTDPADLPTSMIFADGAGAALLGPALRPEIGPIAWGSDGARGQLVAVDDRSRVLAMEGPAVFRWAVTELMPVVEQACRQAGISPRDLAAFVPHQANLRIVDAIARTLDVDGLIVARDVATSGNTSAASVPLALCALREQNLLTSGDLVLLLGFGAGLTYAAQVIRV